MRPVRAVVVGAGLMGLWHARELQRSDGALIGVFDADPAAAERLGGPLATSSLEELLSRSPDAVHVCTPLASHVEIVERCLEAGAHVLCEKPLAPNAATTERLLEAARERGRLLCPCHQYLFQPGVERVASALSDLGDILHIDTVACSAGGEGRPAGELDELVAEIVVHPLGVLERLLPSGVGGLEWQGGRARPGELRGTATTEEATVSLLVSLAGRPTRNELRLVTARGTAHVDFFHGFAVIEGPGVSRARKVVHPFALAGSTAAAAATNLTRRARRAQPAYPGLREMIERLYAAIRSGRPAPVAPEETVAVARARDALAR